MLEGILRESTGKAATKALRQDGYLIANIYGGGIENVCAAFKRNDFIRFVKNKPNLSFEVKVGGKTHKVVIEEYQKDPVTGDLLHVDLRSLAGKNASKFLIPVVTKGVAKGLKNKGVLVMMKRRIPVKCKPADLPNSFEIDVTPLDVGDTIMVRDIAPIKGVQILLDGRVAITGVIKAK